MVTPAWRLIARHELADLIGRMGTKPLTRTLWVVTVFGLVVPWQFSGVANLPAFFALFMAFLPARLSAVDAYAGERERGTLETLLASPLPDRSLVVGKIAAATAYGTARGWLFIAVWLAGLGGLRSLGVMPPDVVPAPGVIIVALAGSLLVAYAAAVFGVWQSARAPSVRAVLESGGLLRLVIIVGVFFIGPWLLGLLSPTGAAPVVRVPGTGEPLSLALTGDGSHLMAAATLAAVSGGIVLWRLTVAALGRSDREGLLLVAPQPGGRGGFGMRRRRGTTAHADA
jgi:ABC-type Na+ efflux pump permease subunit